MMDEESNDLDEILDIVTKLSSNRFLPKGDVIYTDRFGFDSPNCGDPNTPCQTIRQAMSNSKDGGTIIARYTSLKSCIHCCICHRI